MVKSFNLVLSDESHAKLVKLKEKLELANLIDAIERAIDVAFEKEGL
jgi:hypothetical protein